MDRPQIDVWYHGTKEDFSGALKPLYLTPTKNLASMHGNIHAFRMDENAKWLDISTVEYFIPSMDSIGYNKKALEKLKNKGWDVVWDSEDYSRGYQQIFVLNPDVLRPVNIKQEMLKRMINKMIVEVIEEIKF